MTKLSDIAAMLGPDVACPPDGAAREIRGVAALADAGPTDISFLSSEQFLPQFRTTRAAAVIVAHRFKLPDDSNTLVLRVADADLAVANVLGHFASPTPRPSVGIDPAARVDPSASIDATAAIGPFVSIGARSRVGPRTVIHAGAFVGDDVSIGEDCELFANIVIRERITIGNRVVIHGGSALGTDGFGYRWDGQRHAKLPHIGTVILEDDVEIGSCTCIDRAKFGATRVGRGTKIDNLVQIAHNCTIGPHCVLAGQSGLAGSVTLGAGVVLGGAASVRDHVTMGDGAICAACSGVGEDVPPKAIVSGTPAVGHRQTFREVAAIRRLPELLKEFQSLKDEVAAMKSRLESR